MIFSKQVGPVFVEGDHSVLTRIGFGSPTAPAGSAASVSAAAAQLEEYFAGARTEFDLDLELEGTPFQRQVWAALRTIPYGETRSYGEIAEQIGKPGAFRAVGLANGRNPIGIIVPCHRVIGASGSLAGYGGGLDRKQLLLELEHERSAPRLALDA
jgi:methylated-DNA-[protein]-cysteine S-methyltransferase